MPLPIAVELIAYILGEWSRACPSGRDGIQNMEGPGISLHDKIHFQLPRFDIEQLGANARLAPMAVVFELNAFEKRPGQFDQARPEVLERFLGRQAREPESGEKQEPQVANDDFGKLAKLEV